jgi:hypothetical protein
MQPQLILYHFLPLVIPMGVKELVSKRLYSRTCMKEKEARSVMDSSIIQRNKQ